LLLEQPNRYKRVNKESYILFLDHLYIFCRKNKSLNWISCDASGRVDTKEKGKNIFYDFKKLKIEKTKSKDERTKSDVPFLFSFFSGFLF